MPEDLDGLIKEELQAKLKDYQNQADRYFNQEQSIKRILNSIYGAFGNEYFHFFNIDIAESITGQGKDAILYTEKMVNLYFTDFWHKDFDIHKKMGIKVKGSIGKPVGIYIDTDSLYISFEEVIKNSTWQGTEKEFIQQLYNLRLKDYISKVLQKYADSNRTENFLNFELESIAKNAIWLSKKKYIQNLSWSDPDIHFDDLTEIKTKGFEIIQSSTPAFARNKLKALLKIIFADDLQIGKIVNFLKNVKKEFKLADTNDICFNVKMNNYQKYIIDDQNTFEYQSGCPINVRAAGYHNYLLNNSKYKNKYESISSGEKLKLYYTTHKDCNVFAFIAGNYPYEFAPKIDYELQFEKCIIDPLNRVLDAIGLQTLDRNLIYSSSLF